MLCPLASKEIVDRDCQTQECAWWDNGNSCCAVLSICIELIGLGEK